MFNKAVVRCGREGASTCDAVAEPAVEELCRSAYIYLASLTDDHTVLSKTLRRFTAATRTSRRRPP